MKSNKDTKIRMTQEQYEDMVAEAEVSKAESRFDEEYGHQSQYWSF